MFKKLLIIPGIALGVFAMMYLVGTRQQPRQVTVAERATTVKYIQVPQIDLIPRASGYGYVQPGKTWEAVAEVSGRITQMREPLKKGDFVSADDLLFQIEPDSSRLLVQQYEADILNTQAQLAELNQVEKETLRKLETEKKALEINRDELQRQQKLADEGIIAQSQLDKEKLNLLARMNTVENYIGSLDRLPSQRKALEATLKSQTMRKEDAEIVLDKTTIFAPFPARVTEVSAEVGQAVSAGKVLTKLGSIDLVEIEAQIPGFQLRNFVPRWMFAPNTNSTSRSKNYQDDIDLQAIILRKEGDHIIKWKGRFIRFSETDPRTGTMGVVIAVDNPYSQNSKKRRPPLERNMYVEVQLSGKPLAKKKVVPRTAIHENKLYVVNSKNRLERRPVIIEFFQGNLAVIDSGVKRGEKVITHDIVPAIDGMLLKPEEDTKIKNILSGKR
ncbi:MAG: hypothetical protein G3M70_10700 [Candidatus Nitronauta litoralis]|uniref:Multidrug resistance protein MdtA-like barrel-sandwich hybrid domain-containing protein n=1 Tax=Candidatus Nitronauta litoralis TaxID=2705533 RepID=A0A7T0BWI3_9BACT|nr:MAG: hypothetical protein G3M70_10700 [Candidatus Nitronauta litoralis]